MTTTTKPATWYWVVSIIALVWNLMGVMAYFSQVTMSPEALQALPENERNLLQAVPSWVISAFAVAVWGSLLGCILLLLRKRLASIILLISFVAIVIQMYYNFFIGKSLEVYGPGGLAMPIMVLLFSLFLLWFSRKATTQGWLN